MSEIRVNNIVNEAGTGAPQLTYGASVPVGYGITGAGDINITGTISASSVSVNGGSAIPGINTSGTSEFTNVQVGGALTVTGNAVITGNLQVDGTQTILNTTSLEIEDLKKKDKENELMAEKKVEKEDKRIEEIFNNLFQK